MAFGLGPVLRYELITTARRGRYYLVRVVYGTALLFLLWAHFQRWEFEHPDGATPEKVHQFAETTFIAFAQTQFTALLFLLPALVAGVIADEHQRKTLHYLLASRLSSGEIVLGKLGARLLHVGAFVALGLPVVSLLALYGGLDPWKVVTIYSRDVHHGAARRRALDPALGAGPSAARRDPRRLRAGGDLAPGAAGHRGCPPVLRRTAGLGLAGRDPAHGDQPDDRPRSDDVAGMDTGPAGNCSTTGSPA